MTYIKKLEEEVKSQIKEIGYEIEDFILSPSNRPELGDYQINDAMKLASIYKENPREIAQKIKDILTKNNKFKSVEVAGPGFVNLTLSDEALIDFAKFINKDIKNNIDLGDGSTTMIDYGGANVAKVLHVGHLRPANIGEAMRRIALLKGDKVISDVHIGDVGLQAGTVVNEIKYRYPSLPCFQEGYNGEDFDLPIKTEDLNELYPEAAQKAKTDEIFYAEASEITLEIQNGHLAYNKVWKKIVDLSLKEIRRTYDLLNTNFDLWEGEMDAFKYIPEALDIIKSKNLLYESEGAMVVDVAEETDSKELPPAILVKANGAYLYLTTDVGTILGRVKRFDPDKIWYVVDKRQAMYFESVFRVVKKAEIVNSKIELEFRGFGTMNGPDGKPFKTRDGGVMTLDKLIDMIYQETAKKVSLDIPAEQREEIIQKVSIAALKYADLLPQRMTDYIFDVSKFADLEGKTGPYILYSNIRMKSMLEKAKYQKADLNKLKNNSDRELLIALLNMPKVINSAYVDGHPSDIAEYIYALSSKFNKFYAENHVLGENDEHLKNSWLCLIDILHKATSLLIESLAIEIPEKM